MSEKERSEVNLKGRLGLFESESIAKPTVETEIVSNNITIKTPPKEQIKEFSKDRPLVRVGFEIYKDLDKKIERICVEEEKNKKEVINELLEAVLKKR